jgi:hypothetical protein
VAIKGGDDRHDIFGRSNEEEVPPPPRHLNRPIQL